MSRLLSSLWGYVVAGAGILVGVLFALLKVEQARRSAANTRADTAEARAKVATAERRHTSTVADAERRAQEEATVAINAATKAAREAIVRDYFENR